jgi:tellurite resistance protein
MVTFPCVIFVGTYTELLLVLHISILHFFSKKHSAIVHYFYIGRYGSLWWRPWTIADQRQMCLFHHRFKMDATPTSNLVLSSSDGKIHPCTLSHMYMFMEQSFKVSTSLHSPQGQEAFVPCCMST